MIVRPNARILLCLLLVLSGLVLNPQQAPAPAPEHASADPRQPIEENLRPAVIIKGEPVGPMNLRDRMAHYHVPGLGIAFIHNGAVQWTRTFGATGLDGSPVTPDTLFQAGSTSKSVTALAVMRLVEQGKLDLDVNVNQYLKTWKLPENRFTERKPVTLRELLSHTAGVTVHTFRGYPAGATLPTLIQVLDGKHPAKSLPVRVDSLPGKEFRYSSGGYAIVQQVLTDVTGMPFPDFMQQTVLRPLHMTHSTFQQPLPDDLRSLVPTPYDEEGNAIEGGAHTYPEMAAAGLWTTPADLALFVLGVQDALAGKPGAIVSAVTAHEMLRPVLQNYALGFHTGGRPDNRYFYHGAIDAGFDAYLLAYQNGDGVAVMTNGQNGIALSMEIIHGLAEQDGWTDFRTVERAIANVNPAQYDKYAGRYEIEPGDDFTVFRRGDELFLKKKRTQVDRLYPESETRFFILREDLEFTFEPDANGKISSVSLHSPDFDVKASKVRTSPWILALIWAAVVLLAYALFRLFRSTRKTQP